MRALNTNSNIDNSNPADYPPGRIKNNTGSNDGTDVNERVYGDMHQAWAKLMRLYDILPNGLPDNETNGFQLVDALRALASKNDFILPISVASDVLGVPIKIGSMLENEQVVCKSNVNYSNTQTTIKGSDNIVLAFTVIGNFKTGEYVRLIKTATAVLLVRMVDLVNLNQAVSEFLYLKKANYAQEAAGVLDTVATTPQTNALVFVERVNGTQSNSALAIANVRNGLLSKENAQILATLGANPVRNIGTLSGVNIETGSIGTLFPVTGNLVSATLTNASGNASVIRVVVANTMTDINYYVRAFVQSLSSNILIDNAIGQTVFKPINPTTFDISIEEFINETQNLKIHIEVVKI